MVSPIATVLLGSLCFLSVLSGQTESGRPPSLIAGPQITGIEGTRLAGVLNLDGLLYHVQGVDLDSEHIWVTSVDKEAHKGYLHEFSRATAKLERQVEISDGPRFHAGGFSIHGNSIWVPVAEYAPHSSAVIEEIDKHTLAIQRKIAVADHIGCVAVTGDKLIAGNWDSRQFYVFDMTGKQIRVIDNPSDNHYQDIKFDNSLLVASGNITANTGAVDWYAWPSLRLVRRLQSGETDRDRLYTAEGMTAKGGDLYFLPEDRRGRLFHFVMSTP